MKKQLLALTVVLSILFTGCSTIGNQQMTYVGDVTPTKNIVGKSTHFDFLGLGVSADAYAAEYNRAVSNAFRSSRKTPEKLNNVKIYKEYKPWPKVLGTASVLLGYILLSVAVSDTNKEEDFAPIVPVALMVGGTAMWGVNTYDFVVLGEPQY